MSSGCVLPMYYYTTGVANVIAWVQRSIVKIYNGAGAKVNSLGLSSVGAKVKHPLLLRREQPVQVRQEIAGAGSRAATREVVVPLCMQGVRTLLHLAGGPETSPGQGVCRVHSAGHFGWLQAGVRG